MTLRAIVGFRLVTADLKRLSAFYGALGFHVGEGTPIPDSEMATLGLASGGTRVTLSLGPSRVDLDCFDQLGEAYPSDVASCDLTFQHLALVTDDAAAAWRRARETGAFAISREQPITLPPSSGAVTVVKFRDPEGHPLEFLQFPRGANDNWLGAGILGVDHSAISVSNGEASRRFYESLGLKTGDATVNQGPSQEALDDLDDVLVDVTPMNSAQTPPHLELLCYRRPSPRKGAPRAANDIAATRVLWQSDRRGLLRDPDGHLHELMT